jgi:hypothetical protein
MPAIHSSSRHHKFWRAVKHCRYYYRFRHRASRHRNSRKRLHLQTQRKEASKALYSVHPAIIKRLQDVRTWYNEGIDTSEEPG